jgi:hypothetical protein
MLGDPSRIYVDISILILIAALLVSHTKTAKHKNNAKSSADLSRSLHHISHEIRKMILVEEITTQTPAEIKKNKASFPNESEYAEQLERSKNERATYIKTFNSWSDTVCEEIFQCFKSASIPVAHVCLKYFNEEDDFLHLLGANKGREKQDEDDGESASQNPFFMALKITHKQHDHISRNTTSAWHPQNSWENTPRYLAINDFLCAHDTAVEKIAATISADKKITLSPASADSLLNKIKERAKGRYKSCMGILSTDGKTSVKDEFSIIRGFIGIDSNKKSAWISLSKEHVHYLACICDTLFHGLDTYSAVSRELKND